MDRRKTRSKRDEPPLKHPRAPRVWEVSNPCRSAPGAEHAGRYHGGVLRRELLGLPEPAESDWYERQLHALESRAFNRLQPRADVLAKQQRGLLRRGGGNGRARRRVVSIELISLTSASRRASKRDRAIAKAKPIMRGSRPSTEVSRALRSSGLCRRAASRAASPSCARFPARIAPLRPTTKTASRHQWPSPRFLSQRGP